MRPRRSRRSGLAVAWTSTRPLASRSSGRVAGGRSTRTTQARWMTRGIPAAQEHFPSWILSPRLSSAFVNPFPCSPHLLAYDEAQHFPKGRSSSLSRNRLRRTSDVFFGLSLVQQHRFAQCAKKHNAHRDTDSGPRTLDWTPMNSNRYSGQPPPSRCLLTRTRINSDSHWCVSSS